MASTYNNHIIVCGAGKIGYRVILELLKYERDVVVIESDENGRFMEKINLGEIKISETSTRIGYTIDKLIDKLDCSVVSY